MDFEKFKNVFDESFGKVTPDEFMQRMKNLGYEFKEALPICKICNNTGWYKKTKGQTFANKCDCGK